MNDNIANFVDSHKEDVEMTEAGKVRFVLTGMEFSERAPVEHLERYLHGRAMRKARLDVECEAFDFQSLLPHISPHKTKKGKNGKELFLYCSLTRKTLPKDPKVVRKHIEGKKYKRLLAAYQKAEREGEERRRNQEEKDRRRKEYGLKLLKERKSTENHDDEDDDESDVMDVDDEENAGSPRRDSKGNPQECGEEEVDEDTFWTRGGLDVDVELEELETGGENGENANPPRTDARSAKRKRPWKSVPKKARHWSSKRKSAACK